LPLRTMGSPEVVGTIPNDRAALVTFVVSLRDATLS
jgi:hypothetical protein